jgi:hypothetical protein
MEEAFEKALRALGWFRDQNIQIEYRYEVGRRDDPMISEISSLGLDAAVTWSTRLALALTLAAPAVIFLAVAVDPVATGLASVKHSASGWTYYGDNWRRRERILRSKIAVPRHTSIRYLGGSHPVTSPWSKCRSTG